MNRQWFYKTRLNISVNGGGEFLRSTLVFDLSDCRSDEGLLVHIPRGLIASFEYLLCKELNISNLIFATFTLRGKFMCLSVLYTFTRMVHWD